MQRMVCVCVLILSISGGACAQDPGQAPASPPSGATVPATPTAQTVHQDACPQYLPSRGECKVYVEAPKPVALTGPNPATPNRAQAQARAPAHADVAIRPRGKATIVLEKASPLMTCTISETPAALSRDVSTSVSTFITTLGSLGVPGAAAAPFEAERFAPARHDVPPGAQGPIADAARKIEADLGAAENGAGQYGRALQHYQNARATLLANWRYRYESDGDFVTAANAIFAALNTALADPLPDDDGLKEIKQGYPTVSKEIREFETTYHPNTTDWVPAECKGDANCIQEFRAWYGTVNRRLQKLKSDAPTLVANVANLQALQKSMSPAYVWLNAQSRPPGSGNFDGAPGGYWTTIELPMARFSQKQVTVSVTCKDVITQAQPFDAITFTAFYEPVDSWDLEAAGFLSLVPARGVGSVTQPVTPPTTPPTANTFLAVTSKGPVQFVPGAVFDVHPGFLNQVCPWAGSKDEQKTNYHPWGYVCSIGIAGGLLINPNSGYTRVESFEGISLGIHRLAILIGNHTGEFQEFGGGYKVGNQVASGTMPPIRHSWTNHLAIGVAYRIPIR